MRPCGWNFIPHRLKNKHNHHNARRDVENDSYRDALHPIIEMMERSILSVASYHASAREKDMCCKVLHVLNIPDGYASSISRCIIYNTDNTVKIASHLVLPIML